MTDFTEQNLDFIKSLKEKGKDKQLDLNSAIEIFPSKQLPVDTPILQEVYKEPIKKQTYSQDWTNYNLATTEEKIISLQILLELLDYRIIEQVKIKAGRKSLPVKEQIICLFFQAYNGLSSRRIMSDLAMAKENDIISKQVHFNSITHYLRNPNLTRILKDLILWSGFPLKDTDPIMAVDSSGISTTMYGKWMDVRIASENKRRLFRKVHIINGTKTGIIASVDISEGYCGDSPYFRELVIEANKVYNIDVVTADKAYLSRENMAIADELGILPFIPFKENSKKNSKGVRIWRKMFDSFKLDNENYMNIYHHRSNVESCFHSIKRKFGFSIRAKDPVGQENEILMKCLCHNLSVLVHCMFELNIPINYCAKSEVAQK